MDRGTWMGEISITQKIENAKASEYDEPIHREIRKRSENLAHCWSRSEYQLFDGSVMHKLIVWRCWWNTNVFKSEWR